MHLLKLQKNSLHLYGIRHGERSKKIKEYKTGHWEKQSSEQPSSVIISQAFSLSLQHTSMKRNFATTTKRKLNMLCMNNNKVIQ